MDYVLLKSKLHHAVVTQAELEYKGSLTIDEEWMEKTRLVPYEKILVANMANGERFETYAIPGERGSKTICLNGAAAHKGSAGDRLIVMSFGVVKEDAIAQHKPLVLTFDEEGNPS